MTNNHLLLYRIAELMLESEQHVLPVDLLFDDEQIGDFVKSIQIDSPYQQMLLEGVLTESVKDEKLYVSFTVEGYFHYVLGEVIYNQSSGQGTQFLLNIIDHNKLNGAKEGVEQCLIRDVNKNEIFRVIEMIDLGGEAEKVARYPLAHAFFKLQIEVVFNALMKNPSINDWTVIKFVRGLLLNNQKQDVINTLDGIIKESENLRETISSLINAKSEIDFKDALNLISFYAEINALDQAKKFYTHFIEEAEKRSDEESLVVALEKLGESEYKRSGRDGYLAAMDALTKALAIREKELVPQKDKLKHTFKLLGSAYLSLGLQVIKSNEYFQKAKSILLEISNESAELAEVDLYIGIVNFWRGLRGVGRWGKADPSLLENVNHDLFEYADEQLQQAFNYSYKNLGKSHPKTLEAIHYLQEIWYTLGNYEKAIPWLRKYADILPFKNREHTDYFYLYCLIVSLEERAKEISSHSKDQSISLLKEALKYTSGYDENLQISNRLETLILKIQNGQTSGFDIAVPKIDELPELEFDSRYEVVWTKWNHKDELKGFNTNSWLNDKNGLWFFNTEKKQLLYWDVSKNERITYQPENWPEGCGRFVYDKTADAFYAWSSIRSIVYELRKPFVKWNRLSFGVHDVHACGASFGFDPVNNRLFEFGGYGYYTYKNWLWAYDITERKWIQLKENKPGISPFPRNGQMLPIVNGEKVILLSGISSDTGLQREHKVRMGLPSPTELGFFIWLRDAHELDLKTLEWKQVLSPNHESFQHEGMMGYLSKLNIVVNWAGSIPSPNYGQDAIPKANMSCWELNNNEGFKQLKIEGEVPPLTGGYFVQIPKEDQLLFIHQEGIWVLKITQINKKHKNQ